MYKGRRYILDESVSSSPFFDPVDDSLMLSFAGMWKYSGYSDSDDEDAEVTMEDYFNVFPDGFPNDTDEDSPPVTIKVRRIPVSEIKLQKITSRLKSATKKIPLPYGIAPISSISRSPPQGEGASIGTVLSTIRKQTPPSISSTSPVPYVTSASQFPAVPTGFAPATYIDPQDFTSKKLY